ncbi:helix-turn-helix transcriptional regulator [Rhodococcus sp. H29-C3]|uniref:helix-turn-helix domain-containing protein n=1 Tax=Rhodococcus sp. H29-C3 TaxID=3046307 RepID=UPI0032D5A50B
MVVPTSLHYRWLMQVSAGALVREWRLRRRLSQLELAHSTDVSPRHLSYIETGRSNPTSRMLLRLCAQLQIPFREQNQILLAGGFAPAHPQHQLSDAPLADVSRALESILQAHMPFPALVIDRRWDLVTANDAAYSLFGDVDPIMLRPPINVIRLTLSSDGLASRIVNLDQWRSAVMQRLQSEYTATGDADLAALINEFSDAASTPALDEDLFVVPLEIRAVDGVVLSFISTTTVFGTPREVTLSELAIETFYPANDTTRLHFQARMSVLR